MVGFTTTLLTLFGRRIMLRPRHCTHLISSRSIQTSLLCFNHWWTSIRSIHISISLLDWSLSSFKTSAWIESNIFRSRWNIHFSLFEWCWLDLIWLYHHTWSWLVTTEAWVWWLATEQLFDFGFILWFAWDHGSFSSWVNEVWTWHVGVHNHMFCSWGSVVLHLASSTVCGVTGVQWFGQDRTSVVVQQDCWFLDM